MPRNPKRRNDGKCLEIEIVGSDDEMNDCINLDLQRISVWLTANKLTLNMTKTEFLLIISKQRLLNSTASPTVTINRFR